MNLKINQNSINNLTKIGLFLCVIVIIIQLYPTQNKFKYQFEIGKPWSYELITASFDFPIYKDAQLVNRERQEILKNYVPYFSVDTTAFQIQINSFTNAISTATPQHLEFIRNKFLKVYNAGIISADDLNYLTELSAGSFMAVTPNRVSRQINASQVFTPKTAYEEVIKGAPDALKSYDLHLYLTANMKYDSATSELSKTELLKSLSLTSGMIQSGERIIDRGEIVTPETYLILQSLKNEFDKRKAAFHHSKLVVVGEIIIISALITLFFLYLSLFRPRIFGSLGNLIFLSLLILLTVGMSAFAIRYSSLHYYMVPYVLLPIIVRVFFDSRTALFVHIITMLIIAFTVDNSFQFVLLQITVGMAAVSNLKDMTQRSQLAQTALYIFLSYIGVYLATEFIAEGDITRIHWRNIVYFGISSGFLLFAYLLIYIFEKIFGLVSSVTLLELTNINSDLMMEFAERAPGTFQHTLQVSNLATEAAKKINANSLLVRTGALYHDIGKMKNPQYFIENQFGGHNPLLEMNFEEAARAIKQHVTDGVTIAKKHHLPDQIIHFITTHHGFSMAKYFYNSFVNANPGITPDLSAYTYPGPLPDTKETAILMMADAVEARSRSLGVYTEENIDKMVETMIDAQIADGMFKDAPISFRDVETVKNVFKEKIKNMYHSRIAYPEIKK